MAHALNMLGGGAVPEFRRNGEPLNRFFPREAQLFLAPFKPFQRLLKRHRSGAHNVFEVVTMQAVFHFKPAPAQAHWRRR